MPYQLRTEATAIASASSDERTAVDGDNNEAAATAAAGDDDDDDDNGFSYFRRRPTSFLLNGSWRANQANRPAPRSFGGALPSTQRYRWSSTAAAAADTVQYMESIRSVAVPL